MSVGNSPGDDPDTAQVQAGLRRTYRVDRITVWSARMKASRLGGGEYFRIELAPRMARWKRAASAVLAKGLTGERFDIALDEYVDARQGVMELVAFIGG